MVYDDLQNDQVLAGSLPSELRMESTTETNRHCVILILTVSKMVLHSFSHNIINNMYILLITFYYFIIINNYFISINITKISHQKLPDILHVA